MGKKLLLSALVVFLGLFIVDYLWYGLAMQEYYASDNMREDPLWHWLILSYVVFALLFAYMYPKGIEGSNKTGQGARFGATVGLIIYVPFTFMMLSVNLDAQMGVGLVDIVYNVVKLTIFGAIVGNIYGVPGSEPASAAPQEAPPAAEPPPPPPPETGTSEDTEETF